GYFHIAATTANDPARVKTLRQNPIAPGRGSAAGRAALERRTVHVPDIQADPEYNYAPGPTFPAMRAILAVPLLRDGEAVGMIVLFNSIVKPFTQKQIALVSTFANQALIAIENTLSFEAEQASKRELQESLEYQTATSDVLSVISHSKFELQPVLDAIAKIANRLCAADATILLLENGELRLAAHFGPIVSRRNLRAINRDWVSGRTIVDREPIHVHDLASAGAEWDTSWGTGSDSGLHSAYRYYERTRPLGVSCFGARSWNHSQKSKSLCSRLLRTSP